MFQAIKSHKANHGCTFKIFLYLYTVGIITTIWILHKALTNYQTMKHTTGNIENPMKADTIHSKTFLECPCACPEVTCPTNNGKAIPSMPSKTSEYPSTTLYVITPTFCRPEQIAELTRLGQTLKQVEKIHWIVAEDAKVPTPAVKTTVDKMGIPYTILTAPMPEEYASEPGNKPKGVSNRMAALEWLRSNNITRGVIYFADDDNTYDLELFEEIRKIKKVGMWPVGLHSRLGLNSPIVKNGKVVGFYVGWIGDRTFPVDMASFGVNIRYLIKFPNITMPYWSGYEETVFLAGLNITNDDIEPLADNCTKILVWHTKTISHKLAEKTAGKEDRKYDGTNISLLLDQIL